MQTIVIEGATASDEDIRHFAGLGIDVQNRDGKIYLRPSCTAWHPKTVTGLINQDTNTFVGFVLSDAPHNGDKRTVRLISWTQKG